MAKKMMKRRAGTFAASRKTKPVARKRRPATITLRTKAGRRVITSPAKSQTSLASWSDAFSAK
jgi:hypothetical protein